MVFNRYNDRGSVCESLSEKISVDDISVRVGEAVPGWKWKDGDGNVPVVTYYDGEHLDLDFYGKSYKLSMKKRADLLEVGCGGNIYVHQTTVIAVMVEKAGIPLDLPSWAEMHRRGSVNAIAVNAIYLTDYDEIATLWFARAFAPKINMFMLSAETVGVLEKCADEGNPYALFALGRFHLCTQRDEDSMAKAYAYFTQSWEQGVAEAAVSLAMGYDFGEFDIVDRLRAKTLLNEAFEAGCEYAAEYQIRKMIYGMKGTPVDTQKAITICEGLMAESKEKYGEENVNPRWRYFRGCAEQQAFGYNRGKDDFTFAANEGVVDAWLCLAFACSCDEKGGTIDQDAYDAIVKQGAEHGCPTCMYLVATSKVDEYENLEPYAKYMFLNSLVRDLEEALECGSCEAAETLGDIYFFGDFGAIENNDKAFQYYSKGALINSAECYEKVFDMIHNHYIDKPQEFKDMIALYGARKDSRKLLNETVMAYTYGRLTEYAAEIEQYYVPVFDKEEDDGEYEVGGATDSADGTDNDERDDDGRFDAYV